MATTPAEAGHIHNEFLRRVDVIAPLSVGDTISTTSMAEIWKSVVDDMVSDGVIEPITLTNSDVYMMLSDIRHWKNTGVCDFTGQSNPDFANWIDYSEEKEYITAAEAADLQRILDDEYFICTIDSMQTDLGKLAIGVRDSSDAFWVQITGRTRVCENGSRHHGRNHRQYMGTRRHNDGLCNYVLRYVGSH